MSSPIVEGASALVDTAQQKAAAWKEKADTLISGLCHTLTPKFGREDTKNVLKEALPVSVDIVNMYRGIPIAPYVEDERNQFRDRVKKVIDTRITYPYYGYKIFAVQALVDLEVGEGRINIRGNYLFSYTATKEDKEIIKDNDVFEKVKIAIKSENAFLKTVRDELCPQP
jgi:hypothetical protein